MSYSFNVIKKDGELTIEGTGTFVPDGTFMISGHEDEQSRSIFIARIDNETVGTYVVSATGYARR